ncbi:hypothetical protein FGO68_gene2148 [Halteria grandinella]|uniref:Uncharacterized protein n=1 Tax=Halteria grandinella TaxID=5974 RepID=A0A8J8T257_HALGN|nr:hypothetical protein FGO68_gene2148 [Halteria grandinella]
MAANTICQMDGNQNQFHSRTQSQTSVKAKTMMNPSTDPAAQVPSHLRKHSKNKSSISSAYADAKSGSTQQVLIKSKKEASEVQQPQIISQPKSQIMVKSRLAQKRANKSAEAQKRQTVTTFGNSQLLSQTSYSHVKGSGLSRAVIGKASQNDLCAYNSVEDEFQLKLQKAKERQQKLKQYSQLNRSFYKLENSGSCCDVSSIIIDGVKMVASQSNSAERKKYDPTLSMRVRANQKRQQRFKELMSQCVQVGIDASSQQDGIGNHLHQGPLVINYSQESMNTMERHAAYEDTERSSLDNPQVLKMSHRRNYESPEKHIVVLNQDLTDNGCGGINMDEMFQLKVELSSKRNIALKVKEQTKSYDRKHYSHLYSSSNSGVKKEEGFEWDHKLFEVPAVEEKQASPIKKWLKQSKIQQLYRI